MSVSVQRIHDVLRDEWSRGVGDSLFQTKIILSVNAALSELESDRDSGTDFTPISKINTSVDLAAKHEWVLLAGVRYWLPRMGVTPGDPRTAGAILKDSDTLWERARAAYVTDAINAKQSDEDTDIVGQGSLTD